MGFDFLLEVRTNKYANTQTLLKNHDELHVKEKGPALSHGLIFNSKLSLKAVATGRVCSTYMNLKYYFAAFMSAHAIMYVMAFAR